jgi:hypothetical protein
MANCNKLCKLRKFLLLSAFCQQDVAGASSNVVWITLLWLNMENIGRAITQRVSEFRARITESPSQRTQRRFEEQAKNLLPPTGTILNRSTQGIIIERSEAPVVIEQPIKPSSRLSEQAQAELRRTGATLHYDLLNAERR